MQEDEGSIAPAHPLSGTIDPVVVMPKGKEPAPGAMESHGAPRLLDRLAAALPPSVFDGQGRLRNDRESVSLAATVFGGSPIITDEDILRDMTATGDQDSPFMNPDMEGVLFTDTATVTPEVTAAPGPSDAAKDWEEEIAELDHDMKFAG